MGMVSLRVQVWIELDGIVRARWILSNVSTVSYVCPSLWCVNRKKNQIDWVHSIFLISLVVYVFTLNPIFNLTLDLSRSTSWISSEIWGPRSCYKYTLIHVASNNKILFLSIYECNSTYYYYLLLHNWRRLSPVRAPFRKQAIIIIISQVNLPLL